MGQFSAIETHALLMHMTGINFIGLALRERAQTQVGKSCVIPFI